MKHLIFPALCLFTMMCAFAQNSIHKQFDLKDSTFTRKYRLEVKKGSQQINCTANGSINAGEIYFEVLDPEGKHEGGLGLMADYSEESGTNEANGVMTDSFSGPLPGEWTIKVKSKGASGKFEFDLNVE